MSVQFSGFYKRAIQCAVYFGLKVFPLPQNNYVKFVGFGRSSVILEVITGGAILRWAAWL